MDNKNKIGVATLLTGYNYGTSLQAYSVKTILEQMGYDPILFRLKGSFVKGRDVRLGKLFSIIFRAFFHLDFKSLGRYKKSLDSSLSKPSQDAFSLFYVKDLGPCEINYSALKKLAKTNQYVAFVCGSDQIWDSTAYYIDPFYYLDFAPRHMRVAFAPSFGHDFIPKYNKRAIGKKIMGIPKLSVREESGRSLIHENYNSNAEVILDPTLLLESSVWIEKFGLLTDNNSDKFVLAYFLDKPSERAQSVINCFANQGYKIISLKYHCEQTEKVNAGPKEFVQYVSKAAYVCTDSFHGTAFAINFEKQFSVFDREYGYGVNQSTRIESLLDKLNLNERWECDKIAQITDAEWAQTKAILKKERDKAIQYLADALNIPKENTCNE